ncbi:all-trans-retinol 13,14-reductase-like, partial [Empidonax traillii]|uniref:all-trans-retinol 13,14-reductase-like n=1 Tax=Empidonax traillii TaxID=164674 RepID=UPI000FFD51B0
MSLLGIHYVGEMEESSLMRFLMDQLTDGQLEWARLPTVYDTVVLGDPQGNGKTYQIYSGKREYYQKLKEQFPGETAAIDKFQQLVKTTSRGVMLLGVLKMLPRYLVRLLCWSGLLPRFCAFSRMASRSLKEVVDGLTSNPELRAVFSYIFPTYGVIPSKVSFSMHSILVNHFLHGAWYPKGGSGEIVFHTILVIRKAGGNVFGRAPVERILLDSQGRACGVSVKKGQDSVKIFAPIIISDAGIFNTYEKLLPPEAQALPEIQSQLSLVTHGQGCFTVFVGIHYVGEMEESSLMRFLMDQLTDGQLEWARLPTVYDTVVLGDPQGNGKTYQIYSGKREYYQKLKEQFPGETAAIDKFQQLVKSTSWGVMLLGVLKMLPRYLVRLLCWSGLLPRFCAFSRMASRSLKEVVDGLTSNPELRAVFSYIFPTYGVIPSKVSFSMHSILVNHFLHGAWYPKGGSGEIVFHTILVIRKDGGNVFGRAPVERILLDSQGRACGVSVKKGQDSVKIFAPIIISDAGIFNTYEKLLPPEAQALPEIQSQLSLVTHGQGCFTVFV